MAIEFDLVLAKSYHMNDIGEAPIELGGESEDDSDILLNYYLM